MWCDDACMWYDDVSVCGVCVMCVHVVWCMCIHSKSHDRTRTTCKRVTRPYTDNVQASHTTVHGQRASESHDRTRTTCKRVTRPYTDNVQASHTTVHRQRASESHDRTRTTCKRVTRPYTDNVQASHGQQVRHVQLTAPPGRPEGP